MSFSNLLNNIIESMNIFSISIKFILNEDNNKTAVAEITTTIGVSKKSIDKLAQRILTSSKSPAVIKNIKIERAGRNQNISIIFDLSNEKDNELQKWWDENSKTLEHQIQIEFNEDDPKLPVGLSPKASMDVIDPIKPTEWSKEWSKEWEEFRNWIRSDKKRRLKWDELKKFVGDRTSYTGRKRGNKIDTEKIIKNIDHVNDVEELYKIVKVAEPKMDVTV